MPQCLSVTGGMDDDNRQWSEDTRIDLPRVSLAPSLAMLAIDRNAIVPIEPCVADWLSFGKVEVS